MQSIDTGLLVSHLLQDQHIAARQLSSSEDVEILSAVLTDLYALQEWQVAHGLFCEIIQKRKPNSEVNQLVIGCFPQLAAHFDESIVMAMGRLIGEYLRKSRNAAEIQRLIIELLDFDHIPIAVTLEALKRYADYEQLNSSTLREIWVQYENYMNSAEKEVFATLLAHGDAEIMQEPLRSVAFEMLEERDPIVTLALVKSIRAQVQLGKNEFLLGKYKEAEVSSPDWRLLFHMYLKPAVDQLRWRLSDDEMLEAQQQLEFVRSQLS